jgi:hypothetical protein
MYAIGVETAVPLNRFCFPLTIITILIFLRTNPYLEERDCTAQEAHYDTLALEAEASFISELALCWLRPFLARYDPTCCGQPCFLKL